MSGKVLYLGDTSLSAAACYPAGVMSFYGIEFDYVPSDKAINPHMLDDDYAAMLISDYPAENFNGVHFERIIRNIRGGMGLLMIGGWESFTGSGGLYNRTPLADVLPVYMEDTDDRVNTARPCIVVKNINHPVLAGLAFEDDAPAIAGFNSIRAKEDSTVLLWVRQFHAAIKNTGCKDHTTPDTAGIVDFQEAGIWPLLVTGSFGKGRVAAFASDLAPHWAGGFVDWGNRRITARADKAEAIEVGNCYAQFCSNLIKWVAQDPLDV